MLLKGQRISTNHPYSLHALEYSPQPALRLSSAKYLSLYNMRMKTIPEGTFAHDWSYSSRNIWQWYSDYPRVEGDSDVQWLPNRVVTCRVSVWSNIRSVYPSFVRGSLLFQGDRTCCSIVTLTSLRISDQHNDSVTRSRLFWRSGARTCPVFMVPRVENQSYTS